LSVRQREPQLDPRAAQRAPARTPPSQDVTGTTRDRMLLDVPSIRSASAITKRRERIELPARC